jgi:uncharacterized membrane protein
VPSSEVKQRLAEDVALWQADGLIDATTRQELQVRYDTPGFGLVTAVKYLGITGGMLAAMGLLGLVAAVSGSQAVAGVMIAGVSGFLAWAGLRLGRDARARYVHSSKIVLALGVLGCACAVGVEADAMKMRGAQIAFAVGLGVVPPALVIAYRERNGFLLILAVLGIFHWVGSWSGMLGRSSYEFEVQEPRIMAPVAACVFIFGLRQNGPGRFPIVYQTIALIYFNLSLLILSIYPRSTVLPYILVFSAAALAQIVLGARLKSALVMGFGVTALAVDLFTRFFERMWDRVSQGMFFLAGGLLLMAFGALVERAYRRWAG